MKDKRDTDRKLFAVVLCMAILLTALTGCQGVSLRHLKVKIGGEHIVIPDGLARQYYRLRVTIPGFTTGNWGYAEYPSPMLSAVRYPDHLCAKLSGRLVRWCWANGYPDATVPIFRKAGRRQTHAQVLVTISGCPLYFDLTTRSIKNSGPKGWTHYRDAFKYEILNVKEWQ